jgi:hypothetical protein
VCLAFLLTADQTNATRLLADSGLNRRGSKACPRIRTDHATDHPVNAAHQKQSNISRVAGEASTWSHWAGSRRANGSNLDHNCIEVFEDCFGTAASAKIVFSIAASAKIG